MTSRITPLLQQKLYHLTVPPRLERGVIHTMMPPKQTSTAQYYHVELRPQTQYTAFTTRDFGDHGHVLQVLGKRYSGEWETVALLISKRDAHLSSTDTLVLDDPKARGVLKTVYGPIYHIRNNFFRATPRYRAGEKPSWSVRHVINNNA